MFLISTPVFRLPFFFHDLRPLVVLMLQLFHAALGSIVPVVQYISNVVFDLGKRSWLGGLSCIRYIVQCRILENRDSSCVHMCNLSNVACILGIAPRVSIKLLPLTRNKIGSCLCFDCILNHVILKNREQRLELLCLPDSLCCLPTPLSCMQNCHFVSQAFCTCLNVKCKTESDNRCDREDNESVLKHWQRHAAHHKFWSFLTTPQQCKLESQSIATGKRILPDIELTFLAHKHPS